MIVKIKNLAQFSQMKKRENDPGNTFYFHFGKKTQKKQPVFTDEKRYPGKKLFFLKRKLKK